MDAKHFRFLVFKAPEHFIRRRDAVQIYRARRQGGKTLRLSLSTRTHREQQQYKEGSEEGTKHGLFFCQEG
jgi:hypothetical protein